ncbi:MAG: hypothetical protein NTX75_12755 [Proteobacteria bacterium]|nr:hypothetical protein [Pseudomonadota bacterium]
MSERHRQLAALQDALAINTYRLAAGLAIPVWYFDDSHVDKIIEGMLNDRHIYCVVVANATGNIHVRLRDAQWGITAADKEFPANGLFVEERLRRLLPVIMGSPNVSSLPMTTPQTLPCSSRCSNPWGLP